MPTVTDALVNTAEAARALNVHPTTLRRWAESGIVTVTAQTAGGHARWDVEQVRRQVQEHLGQQGDQPSTS